MKRFAITLLLSLNLSGTGYAEPITCKNGGQEYSAGATICECPSLKGDGKPASGGRSQITSRRLTCDRSGEWKSTDSLCLDVESAGGVGAEDYPKYYNLYCPRVVMTRSEQSFGPSILALATVSRICGVVPAFSGPCKALVLAIALAVQ
jgi:hypothetical protein